MLQIFITLFETIWNISDRLKYRNNNTDVNPCSMFNILTKESGFSYFKDYADYFR